MKALAQIVNDYAQAFKAIDASRPVNAPYRPGIGLFGEPKGLALALEHLRQMSPTFYGSAQPRPYPGERKVCDLVIPGAWAIEFKLLRPFGDNDREAEHWSENVLHPYPGHTSAVGDCLKLATSAFDEHKAVVVYGFEHSPPRINLEPAVRAFELVATQVMGIVLGSRHTATFDGLIHPVHQQGTVFAWEILRAVDS